MLGHKQSCHKCVFTVETVNARVNLNNGREGVNAQHGKESLSNR